MEFRDLVKFEPINITQIIVTVSVLLIVIYSFKTQLNGFINTLQNRPITVKISGTETTIKLDVPVTPELLAISVTNPDGTQEDLSNWEETVKHIENIEGFEKMGFHDLYEKLSSLDSGNYAVINYQVNDTSKNYFNDESMLRYLSVASEKVNYLAFYLECKFVAAIKIQAVISGLASKRWEFQNFGSKVKNGDWISFPGLLSEKNSFAQNPSIRELNEYLTAHGLDEVPLVQNNTLVGFLNYKSISNELYGQASGG